MFAGLHGRVMEMAELEGHLAAVTTHRGRGVTLVGPAGIGKTSLLNAAADAARRMGIRVLWARGAEAQQTVPYGVIRQLLERAVQGEVGVGGAAARGRALVLGEPLHNPDAEGTIGLDVCWLVADIAAAGPVALCVDDLHWVDADSLRVLDLLRVRIDGLPVLLLAATRELPSGPWSADASMYQLHVSALLPEAVGSILKAALGSAPPRLIETCAEITGGNPFLLRELVRTLRRSPAGAATDPAIVDSLVPDSILNSVNARLTALGPAARLVAQAMSLLGDGTDLTRAAEVSGLALEAAADAAELLVADGILAAARPVRFAHPLLLSAVREAVPAAARSRLHAHAARTFHVAPGGLDLACAHLLEVNPAGDREVVAVLRQGAAHARAMGAPEAALTYLRRALTEPVPAEDEAEILLELARTAADAQAPDALELANLSVERASDPTGAVSAAINAGHLIVLNGRVNEAIDVLTGVYDAHALPPPLAEAAMTLVLGWTYCSASARGVDSELVRSAQALMESPEAPLALRSLMAFEAATGGGSAELTVELARLAWADGGLLREVGLFGPFVHFPIIACVAAGDLNRVEQWSERVLAESLARGAVHGRALSSAWLASASDARGELSRARALASESFDLLSPSDAMNLILTVPVTLLAEIALVTEGAEAAAAALDLLPVAARDPQLMFGPMWWMAKARVALASGRPDDALADLAEVESWQRHWPAEVGGTSQWHPLAVEAHLALGDHDQARALADEALSRARAFGADRPLARALRASALTLAVADRVEPLDEALALTARGVCGVDGVRYRVDLAQSEVALGNHSVAVEHLREAVDLADRAGATVLATEAVELLVLHDGRPPPRRRHGAITLTPSERRVVDVALEGRRNREIAEQLFLTEKTVESHLTSAYRKLGIRSRGQLEQALSPNDS